MGPRIRPMSREDKPAVMQILRATPEFTPEEVVVAGELCDYYLEDPVGSGYHVFVAEADSAVAGYICYGPTPLTEGTWDVYWIAVAPDKQRQGIGKVLIAFAEAKIKETSGRIILIETSSKPSYERTRLFYLALGYTAVCRIPDFYTVGDDLIIMQKRLS